MGAEIPYPWVHESLCHVHHAEEGLWDVEILLVGAAHAEARNHGLLELEVHVVLENPSLFHREVVATPSATENLWVDAWEVNPFVTGNLYLEEAEVLYLVESLSGDNLWVVAIRVEEQAVPSLLVENLVNTSFL